MTETRCSYWTEMEKQLGPSLDTVLKVEEKRSVDLITHQTNVSKSTYESYQYREQHDLYMCSKVMKL